MKTKKIFSLLLAFTLIFTLSAPAALAAGGEGTRVLHIADAETLLRLSVDCAEDDYSVNLKVILDNDIDLEGVEFHPIPSFSGIFDGGGHSILNMKTATDGSHQGFFRYIQAGAAVENLNVTGQVCPEGSRNQIGGIAGVNFGTIDSCSFTGTVKGLNHVGGIAGVNHGTIIDCVSSGTIDGKRCTGGIAGMSDGILTGSENEMRVNTSLSFEKKNIDEINLADITNIDLANADDEDIVSDSGGIAGYSTGSISLCVNRGTVGYKHYGYNVGGIAGRQSGYIFACENYGNILGRKDVGGIVGQMEPYMILTDAINLPAEVAALHGMVQGTMGNVGDITDELGSAAGGGAGGLFPSLPDFGGGDGSDGGISDAGPGGISGDNDGGGGLGGWFPSYYPSKDLVNSIGSSTGAMAQGLVGISGQMARIILIMANAISGKDRALVVDISDEVPDEENDGRVKSCTNFGSIDADKNVGGVAGEMGIEYEFDLEGTLGEFFGFGGILSATYQTKCISDRNINKGAVLGKKDNIGGIVGLESLGIIIKCEGYGSVESSEGGCVGGIAGRSESTVRDSYAMCNLTGNANVGGIVGHGSIIQGCGSLVGISDTTVACCGAIAGWADIEAADTVSGNRYVHESIGAVDGISYAGQAEKMSYGEFLSIEGLPEQFRKLKLSFRAQGETVKEVEFSYGGSVDESEIPPVPEKEGFSGSWPEYDYSDLYFSDTIEAVYTPRQAAIASDNLRGDTPLSIVLLEGDFSDSAYLSLSEYSGAGPALEEGEAVEMWLMHIVDDDSEALEEGYGIRFAPPESEKKISIYVYENNSWRLVNTGQSGSYLTFEGSGDTLVFCAVESEKEGNLILIIAAAAGALLIIIIAAAIIKKKKAKKASARTEELKPEKEAAASEKEPEAEPETKEKE